MRITKVYITGIAMLAMTVGLLSACSDDDEPYPNMITCLADCITDTEGKMQQMRLDNGTAYTIGNNLNGLQPSAAYRFLCSYTLDGNTATLYSLTTCHVLRDSTNTPCCDPVNVVSTWREGPYINLHLTAKTQGGKQYWGTVTDSIRGRHIYLTLHHRQADDPEAYSTDVYASIPTSNLDADSVSININTYSTPHQRTYGIQ